MESHSNMKLTKSFHDLHALSFFILKILEVALTNQAVSMSTNLINNFDVRQELFYKVEVHSFPSGFW